MPDNDDLLSKRLDAFNLAVLGPGGAAPLRYGHIKFLKSLTFDSVSRGRTFAPHMMDETRKVVNYSLDAREAGRQDHMKIEELTLGSYLQPGVRHRRARHGSKLMNIITLKLTLNYTTLTDTATK